MECVHNFWGTRLNRWGTVRDHCRQHQRKRKHEEGVKALTQVSEKCVSVDSLVLIVAEKDMRVFSLTITGVPSSLSVRTERQ